VELALICYQVQRMQSRLSEHSRKKGSGGFGSRLKPIPAGTQADHRQNTPLNSSPWGMRKMRQRAGSVLTLGSARKRSVTNATHASEEGSIDGRPRNDSLTGAQSPRKGSHPDPTTPRKASRLARAGHTERETRVDDQDEENRKAGLGDTTEWGAGQLLQPPMEPRV
jgi:hypothetical protein